MGFSIVTYAQQSTIFTINVPNATLSNSEVVLVNQYLSNAKKINEVQINTDHSLQFFNYDHFTNEYISENQQIFTNVKALVFKRIKDTTSIQSLDFSQLQNLEYLILESKMELSQQQIQNILANVTVADNVKIVFKYIYVN